MMGTLQMGKLRLREVGRRGEVKDGLGVMQVASNREHQLMDTQGDKDRAGAQQFPWDTAILGHPDK
jgi:hypothetical protein